MGGLEQVEAPPRVCCQDLANRGEPERMGDDLSVARCTVCGAAHYLLTVDTAHADADGEELL